MSTGDYNVVIDVDDEGDLGDLEFNQELEFHHSGLNQDVSGKMPSSGSQTSARVNGQLSTPSRVQPAMGSEKHYLWSLDFYARFFDVDTSEVLRRCWAALFPKSNFLDLLEGNPDLYGPLWITTTVVLILFLSSTIQGFLANSQDIAYTYNFDLLSGAAGLMYGYSILVPTSLWGVLRYYGCETVNLLECLCLYGYSNLIWIPVAIASASPVSLLNWILAAVGFAASTTFLMRSLGPVVNATDFKTAKVLLVLVVALHGGLSLAIEILFFHHTSPVSKP